MAARADRAVQEVGVDALQQRLRGDGAVLAVP
jgi:hypothetical protein